MLNMNIIYVCRYTFILIYQAYILSTHASEGPCCVARKLQTTQASWLCTLGALREAKQWQLAINWLRTWSLLSKWSVGNVSTTYSSH